ncbi:MAG: hypothetical protein SCG72_03440 [Nitrosarchaeum sp.]|nr:hypothetical protein [Nitrosarchaeum sp.]
MTVLDKLLENEEYKLKLKEMPSSIKITSAIFLNLPHHPENLNDPETGRQNFYSGLAYETNQLQKCASAVVQELINEFASDDGLIKAEDLRNLIEEWK